MQNSLTPWQSYQVALTQGFEYDAPQEIAAQALEQCYQSLQQEGTPRGVYLWGPVGRGKTWLMDSFYQALRIPARRQHFHHFMAWLHQRLFHLTGQQDPLQKIAAELAAEVKVLCFDEFFVSDIGDALLLGPLLSYLFEQGLVLVTTSNQAPEQLYEGGFNRHRFLPAIDALLANVQVVQLDGGRDHRSQGSKSLARYWLYGEENFSALFKKLSGQIPVATELLLNGRSIRVEGEANRVLWCTYSQLCEGYRSAQDYMALCDKYQHILLSQVPRLGAPTKTQYIARGTEDAAQRVAAGDRHLVALSAKDNSVRRFIALVDECYEQQTPLYIEAEVPLDQLYQEGALLFPFRRTQSRLGAF